ncbi:MAG: hypothetical protein IIZ59_02815 [Clostridia bacterium]|nr:hypothetical protein [Clostridia bacterium]
MIGQHLILRCAKGCYDHTSAPGLKTAAVSENIISLQGPRQQELNKVISEHAQFPDVSAKGSGGENRGVLRLFEYRGVLMALRTFRVHDLCDTGGTVSFTQTYMIADDNTGDDRQYLLKHPESFCSLPCFDNYKDVAKRTEGGLSSGNPVPVKKKHGMPNKKLPRFDSKIFEKCGFTEETFAKFVSSVCRHVSSKGWVAVVAPNITEKSWDEQGGSLEGEQLITAVMALMPDCIARFLNAVSYWNDNPSDDCLKDYHLRVLSGKFTDGLVDAEISYFNFVKNIVNTDSSAGSFGKFLWKIKDDAEKVAKFHDFIEAAFGKNVDKIAKMPALMDALTELYIFTNDDIKEPEIDRQMTLSAFLVSIGTSLPVFPNIYKGTALLINAVRESGELCSDKLENVIMQLLKNPDIVKLNSCYENLIGILMHSVNSGTAKEKTVTMIGEQLGSKDGDEYRDQFGKLLSALIDDPKAKPSYSMLSLLLDAEDVDTLKDKKEDISAVITKCYKNALEAKDFELCARMTAKQLRKDAPPDNVAEICKRMVELTDFVSPETAEELVKSISIQIDKFNEYDDVILTMGKAVFGTEIECDIAAYPEFFPIFMKLLSHGIKSEENKDYVENVWYKQYVWVIQNTNEEIFLYPEQYLEPPTEATVNWYSDMLYVVEKARLEAKVGYDSDWHTMETIVSTILPVDPVKGYTTLQDILDRNTEDSRVRLLAEIIGTPRMYGLFLALYDSESDRSNYLVEFIIQDVNAFDMLIYTAETEGFVDRLPTAYVHVWNTVYYQLAQDPSMLENCWIGILDTEQKVVDKPYCDDIMSTYANYFSIVFEDLTYVPDIKDEYIALMYRGIVDYRWDIPLELDEQQKDIVEMCYMIDNGGDDGNAAYCIDYFVERLSQLAKAGEYVEGPAANIMYCVKRMNSKLNKDRRRITDGVKELNDDMKSKYTLLSLARMYGQRHDEPHSLYYLKGICEGDDHWIAPLYLFYGLKYLYIIEPEVSLIINDFLDRLRAIIIKTSNAGRQTMLSPECQDLYHSYVQPHLYHNQQKPLHKAAQGTGNQELVAMFEINVTKEAPKQSGIRGFFRR